MNAVTPIPLTGRLDAAAQTLAVADSASLLRAVGTSRVLRNPYALLSMTLLFSAAIAAASVAFQLPAPGILLTLGGCFGLLLTVCKFKNSGWALPAVSALTGLMGYSLGPVLAKSLAFWPGGAVRLDLQPVHGSAESVWLRQIG